MIITLSDKLNTALKNAFGDRFQTPNKKKIASLLMMDPSESQIDVCIFNLNDLGSTITNKNIITALKGANDNVILIGLDDGKVRESVRNKVPAKPNLYIVPFNKGDDIGEIIDNTYSRAIDRNPYMETISMEDEISSDVQTMGDMQEDTPRPNPFDSEEDISFSSTPTITPEESEWLLGNNSEQSVPNPFTAESTDFTPTDTFDAEPTPEEPATEEPVSTLDINTSSSNTSPYASNISAGVEPEFFNQDTDIDKDQTDYSVPEDSINEKIVQVNEFKSLQDLARDLDKNKIYKELLQNSTAFQDVTAKLKIVDQQVMDIRLNNDLTASQRIEELKRVCEEKASLKGVSNSLVVDYLCNIIDNVASAAIVQMDSEINKLKTRIASLSERELYKGNEEVISRLCDERYKIQIELTNHLTSINELCGILTDVTLSTEDTFIEGIPTKNPYINEFLKPVSQLQPLNLAQHINTLFEALQKNSVKFSVIEAQIRSLMQTTSKLVDLSDNIIAIQQDLISSMKVQKIEEVIIVSSMLKNIMRVYAGGKHSGKTAATAVISEIHNRRGETMLLDLTENNSMSTYINDMVDINTVMQEQNVTAYNHIYCKTPLSLDFKELIQFLTDNTQKYRYIDVLVDNVDVYRKLQEEALTVTVFMQPNIESINDAKHIIDGITIHNIAKQICVVNPAVEPSEMFDILAISPNEYKYTSVPNMPEINKCALRRTNPGLVKEIRSIFEEEFS